MGTCVSMVDGCMHVGVCTGMSMCACMHVYVLMCACMQDHDQQHGCINSHHLHAEARIAINDTPMLVLASGAQHGCGACTPISPFNSAPPV